MDSGKKKRLGKRGRTFGDAKAFLGLSEDELAYIELKLAFGRSLRQQRRMRKMTQVELAGLIKSSQSRVAKMEAGDPSVSFDLLIRCLLALGATNRDLARMMAFSKLIVRTSRS